MTFIKNRWWIFLVCALAFYGISNLVIEAAWTQEPANAPPLSELPLSGPGTLQDGLFGLPTEVYVALASLLASLISLITAVLGLILFILDRRRNRAPNRS